MSWGKIKRDPADKLFSEYIRKRDGRCVRCGKTENLQCSHFWSRRMEGVRFDPINAEALCPGCHKRWEHQKEIKIHDELIMGEYAQYKLEKLGQRGYDLLKLKAHKTYNKDRKLALITVKELMKTL